MLDPKLNRLSAPARGACGVESPLLAELAWRNPAWAQGDLVANAADALDVFDFEAVARQLLPPAHWGYMATGVDGDDTLRANREGFDRYQLRVRRLVDVSRIDMSTELFGMKLASPLVLCPVGSQKAFHPEDEVAVARAAKAKGNLQILSTVSSSPIEDVVQARGGPIWYQLYTLGAICSAPPDRMSVITDCSE